MKSCTERPFSFLLLFFVLCLLGRFLFLGQFFFSWACCSPPFVVLLRGDKITTRISDEIEDCRIIHADRKNP